MTIHVILCKWEIRHTIWQLRIFSYGLHGSIAGNIDITPPDVVVFNVILVSNTVHQHSAWGMDMYHVHTTWWRHQIETFSALLAFCWGNSPVTGEFPSQRPVTRSFGVYFDPRLNKRLSKLSKRCDFRRNRAHYDVTVLKIVRCNNTSISLNLCQ